jgi:hypothetical protein
VLHAFAINALLGGKRFAHLRRLQDDRAVAAILGFKKGRICGDKPLRTVACPGKLVESGRQKTLKLAVSEKWWAAISQAYKRLQRWLARTAPQLDVQQTFECYLCWHNPLSPQNWLADLSP